MRGSTPTGHDICKPGLPFLPIISPGRIRIGCATTGKELWLDPGEKAAAQHSLRVVMDVVQRYDVDGVHFDDYFYPYPEHDRQGKDIEFPDESSWRKFGLGKGVNREDWRRQNVDEFVRQAAQSIKATKPWVKFGISPFGIWRPGNPPAIKGTDAFEELHADSRKWLVEGWVDYLSPQLYWAINPPQTSFTVLLGWWAQQNPRHRLLAPGLCTSNVGGKWRPEEILSQIRITATRRNQWPHPLEYESIASESDPHRRVAKPGLHGACVGACDAVVGARGRRKSRR